MTAEHRPSDSIVQRLRTNAELMASVTPAPGCTQHRDYTVKLQREAAESLERALAQIETAMAGYHAAVSHSNWQPRTNSELNELQEKIWKLEGKRG